MMTAFMEKRQPKWVPADLPAQGRSAVQMDIVDAQAHMGPGRIDEMLSAMDAVGIAAIVIDEYWTGTMRGDPQHVLASGALPTSAAKAGRNCSSAF